MKRTLLNLHMPDGAIHYKLYLLKLRMAVENFVSVGGYLCVSECIFFYVYPRTCYPRQLVLSQWAGGSTIFRKAYAHTVCNVTQ